MFLAIQLISSLETFVNPLRIRSENKNINVFIIKKRDGCPSLSEN
jgi:hypothetical protein